MLSFGTASSLSIGWSWALWPQCTNWDMKKRLCSALMDAGVVYAALTWIVGLVWLSLYPRWWVGALVCIFFLVMIVFGMTPHF
jgi:hypothetical protein